ncbi:MAG: RNHCP domain-containing protein [Candidatus Peregrinibacteria bacterium]|nr:RNHCP domain-containing protein [Candidatus Peregrinibacteria bacterium]
MKRFTVINEGFKCEVCGYENSPAEATCRDHCIKCLCSKHVDVNPGDRAETCQGVLRPLEIEISGAELKSIIYKCEKCKVTRKNKIAIDDDREKLFEIIEKNGGMC